MRQGRTIPVTVRVAPWVADALDYFLAHGKRVFKSRSACAAWLLQDSLNRHLPEKEVVRRQREAAKEAERKVG